MAHFAQHENDSGFAPCHTARLRNIQPVEGPRPVTMLATYGYAGQQSRRRSRTFSYASLPGVLALADGIILLVQF